MAELIQAGENTFYLECPNRIGIYRDGKDAWLIDSGIDKDSAKKALKAIEQIGCTLKAVLNTHGHADHVGGNKTLLDRTGCSFYADSRECCSIANTILNTAVVYGAYPPENYRKDKFFYAEPVPVQPLEKAVLPEGFSVISLPGHSIGMTGYRTPDGVVFAGDAVSGEKVLTKYHVSYIYNIEAFLESLTLLSKTEGTLFVPCHAPAVEKIDELAELNRSTVLEILSVVKNLCADGKTYDALLKGLFEHFGLYMNLSQYVLVGATLRAYLTALCDRGEVRMECREAEVVYISEGKA